MISNKRKVVCTPGDILPFKDQFDREIRAYLDPVMYQVKRQYSHEIRVCRIVGYYRYENPGFVWEPIPGADPNGRWQERNRSVPTVIVSYTPTIIPINEQQLFVHGLMIDETFDEDGLESAKPYTPGISGVPIKLDRLVVR